MFIMQNRKYYWFEWIQIIWTPNTQLMILGTGLTMVENPEYITLQMDELELSEHIQNHL